MAFAAISEPPSKEEDVDDTMSEGSVEDFMETFKLDDVDPAVALKLIQRVRIS